MAGTRDPWLDNAKMALVTLVVVGHAWTLLPDDAVNRHLYDFLYAWHIPAFVLVTGYLSRGFDWTGRAAVAAGPHGGRALRALRVRVRRCSASTSAGEKLEDLFLDPHWPLWYLPALFLWRLVTPIFRGAAGRRCALAVVAQPARPASGSPTPSTWPGCSGCCRSSCSA